MLISAERGNQFITVSCRFFVYRNNKVRRFLSFLVLISIGDKHNNIIRRIKQIPSFIFCFSEAESLQSVDLEDDKPR